MVERSLLATLTGLKLCIYHPDNQSAKALTASLAQLGCQAVHGWPLPATAPNDVDLVIMAIEPHHHQRLAGLMKELKAAAIPAIALVDSQNTSLFPLLIELKPSAILDKIINPFAFIVQIIGTMEFARERNELRNKVAHEPRHNENKQKVTRAKGILMREYGVDEKTAYAFIRREAMNSRSSLDSTADRVISGRGYGFFE